MSSNYDGIARNHLPGNVEMNPDANSLEGQQLPRSLELREPASPQEVQAGVKAIQSSKSRWAEFGKGLASVFGFMMEFPGVFAAQAIAVACVAGMAVGAGVGELLGGIVWLLSLGHISVDRTRNIMTSVYGSVLIFATAIPRAIGIGIAVLGHNLMNLGDDKELINWEKFKKTCVHGFLWDIGLLADMAQKAIQRDTKKHHKIV
jgi:phage-related minor tail protein